MRPLALLAGAALIAAPLAASAQSTESSPTQTRDGRGNAGHPLTPSNSLPSGSVNATTGPQSRPAHPSGSTTANPGAAFVRTQPKSATGPLAAPPGNLGTSTITPSGTVPRPASPGVGEEGAGRAPAGR